MIVHKFWSAFMAQINKVANLFWEADPVAQMRYEYDRSVGGRTSGSPCHLYPNADAPMAGQLVPAAVVGVDAPVAASAVSGPPSAGFAPNSAAPAPPSAASAPGGPP